MNKLLKLQSWLAGLGKDYTLDGLKKLKWLDLSRNSLTVVPPELSELKKLEYLDLGRNSLTTLPTELTELKKLKSLWLEDNPLTIIEGSEEYKFVEKYNHDMSQFNIIPDTKIAKILYL